MTDYEEKQEYKEMINQYKKEANEAISNIVLNEFGDNESSFSEYKDESLDWSWDNIMKE